MVLQWSHVPLTFTFLTMYLCYEKISVNQLLEEQMPLAVGYDDLPDLSWQSCEAFP